MQPKQHGGSIGDVEHIVASLIGPEAVIIEVERSISFVQCQMEQCLVPPQMVAEIMDSVFPMHLVLADPCNTFGGAPLHLHDMSDRVDRPRIRRVDRHSPAPERFGARIVASLLQPEGTHTEHIAVARHGFVPGRQDTRDTVPVLGERAVIEVQVMRKADREDVARVVQQDVLETAHSAGGVASSPAREGVHMSAFARRRGKPVCLLARSRGPRTKGTDAHQQEETALENMSHRHFGISVKRSLQQRASLSSEGEEIVQRRIQGGRRFVAGRSQFQAAFVQGHCSPL